MSKKDFDVYVEPVELYPDSECHGAMVSGKETNPGLRFYYKRGKNWICECYEYDSNSYDVYFVSENENYADLIDEKYKLSSPEKTIDKYLSKAGISLENRKYIKEFIIESEKSRISKIYHVVYNYIRGTFQKLENNEDNSFWFTTSDYLRWYLKVLDSNYIYLEDKEEQAELILEELRERGFNI